MRIEQARGRRSILAAGTLILAGTFAALTWGLAASAQTSTLFTDNFEDGNTNGWSKSGGSWSVVTDGTKVLKQSSTRGDARIRAGSSGWANYAVQARVKPLSFDGSDRFVALLARAEQHQLLLPDAAQRQPA